MKPFLGQGKVRGPNSVTYHYLIRIFDGAWLGVDVRTDTNQTDLKEVGLHSPTYRSLSFFDS